MVRLDEFFGPNAGYVVELLDRPREPAAEAGAEPGSLAAGRPEPGALADSEVTAAAAAADLAQAIRTFGHLAAQLDPLGTPPPGEPQLAPAAHGLTEADLARLPPGVAGKVLSSRAANAAEAIGLLRRIYCTTTGYELAHVQVPDERAWLTGAIERQQFWPPEAPIDERGLLDRLTEVSAFERFLQRVYPGQTRFSVEGLGMLIPMLDELVAEAADAGTRTIPLGMAHRGRLNVLAHVLGKPYQQIIAEFEGREQAQRVTPGGAAAEGWTGDVKYHAGARRVYQAGEEPGAATVPETVTVVMVPNPSHLEFVNPVVQGMARAADEDRHRAGPPAQDELQSLAVLIHGDAAFPGQGVVAETLNLSRLAGYRTGGTVHLIANNQLGFTTEPADARSTLYASDLAKGFEIPVIHVNADDPVACLAAVRLAVAYRGRFRKDVLVDLVGYRRWGHNEGDEASFTQPGMYARIANHPTVRELFAADLVKRGVVDEGEPERLLRAGLDEFQQIRESVLKTRAQRVPADQTNGSAAEKPTSEPTGRGRLNGTARDGAPDVAQLRALNDSLLAFPPDFQLNPKLERALQRRRAAFEGEARNPVDWAHAEALAFAWILRDGTPIRLTGQDVVRGTFSQRHVSFFDTRNGEPFTPLQALPDIAASFEVRNSPLSENAAVGFEYGYSVQAPDVLVVWEAQYGDFVNGAQVMIDEFLVSGQAKWGLRSGLVLLLPHAWEGQGPDHSGGRLERFLQLAAEGNIRVANCTTSAQYFFLLRRQAASLASDPRPLVVMTPKSLLRHSLSASPARELAGGAFQPVLDDARATESPRRVRRLVLCSGKVWADLEAHPGRAAEHTLAVIRLEQLYPYPEEALAAVLARYPRATDVIWLQEEPRNFGAWSYVEPRLRPLLHPDRTLAYAGRPARASPAEGWADMHAVEQRRILDLVFEKVVSHAR